MGRERCASVAHLPGAGPFVKRISLSVESPGAGKSVFDLASAYVPPQGAPGKTHMAIRDEVLSALEATSGRRSALMGDINCDLGDDSPGAQAWAQALSKPRVRIPNPNRTGLRSESEPGGANPNRTRTWPGETEPNPNPAG